MGIVEDIPGQLSFEDARKSLLNHADMVVHMDVNDNTKLALDVRLNSIEALVKLIRRYSIKI